MTIASFSGTAIYPASLIQGSDGNFYGVANTNINPLDDVIFKMTPSGTISLIQDFPGAETYFTLVNGQDDNVYGVAANRGHAMKGSFFG